MGYRRLYQSNGALGRVDEYEEGELIGNKYFYDDAEETLKSSTRTMEYTVLLIIIETVLFNEVPVKGFRISSDTILSSSVVEYDSEGQRLSNIHSAITRYMVWSAGPLVSLPDASLSLVTE